MLLIFLKWNTNYQVIGTQHAPSIINQMINIPLKGGEVIGNPLIKTAYYQQTLQQFIVKVCLLCVVLILFPKIIYYFFRMQSKLSQLNSKYNLYKSNPIHKNQNYIELQDINDDQDHKNINIEDDCSYTNKQQISKEKDEIQDEFSGIMVHQIIETIEFVLGSISNTASYLRLWALSLAHGQLSKVFFEKCLEEQLKSGSMVGIIIGYIIFMNVTFAVLLCMDLMECFLHSLRLQW